MKNFISAALSITLLGIHSLGACETIKIPVGQQADKIWSGESPARGITKEQVEKKFGRPISQNGPTGQPPIFFWEYPDFTVYFEGNHVIHSVIKHRPVADKK